MLTWRCVMCTWRCVMRTWRCVLRTWRCVMRTWRCVMRTWRSSIPGGAQHTMCCAPLAIVDRRYPEVRSTRAVPAGERLLARNRRPNDYFSWKFAAAGAARKTLRADPSPDGMFTVKQVRRVACDQPPPPSPNGTTPTHTTEYSSTKSVLLNPNRRHPNPPNDYCFRKLGSPCVAPIIVFVGFAMVPHPHTHEYSSTKSVLLNPNRRHPNPPNDCFF
jgi:hypothetical protein